MKIIYMTLFIFNLFLNEGSFLIDLIFPLSLDHRGDPVGSGIMGEVHFGPVHLTDSWKLHQRSLRAHRNRNHNHCFRTVRMFRHLPRKSMDAQAGERFKSKPSAVMQNPIHF